MTPRSRIATALVLGTWLLGLGPISPAGADDFTFYHDNVLGTSMELRVVADDAGAARRAEARVLAEVDRLAAIFSNHDPSSEFRRWQAASGGPIAVSPELLGILQEAGRWRLQSGGAFEPGVQVLTRLWSRCASEGRKPTPSELAGACASLARPAWRLDPASGTAELLGDVPLTLDAIAKGEIVERAGRAGLGSGDGVRGLLLNVGGDLRVCGDLDQEIAIAAPRPGAEGLEPISRIVVRDRAVATSGGQYRGFTIGGRHYSHILDPRTGLPAEGVAGATVIAARSADADALATILNVLPPDEGVRLVDGLPDADCLIIGADGRLRKSDGWDRFEQPEPVALAQAGVPAAAPALSPYGGKGAPWGDAWEMEVEVEINRPDDGVSYRRPYLAVWVENKEGFPVRTIGLWVSSTGGGPSQWLPDLRRWYRADAARKRVDNRQMVLAWAQPTRPPGKVTVVWDGNDDKKRPVGRGEYTVFIEAAREHGTYQIIRLPVTIADEPFAEELPGNVEIRSARVAYRRKPAAP